MAVLRKKNPAERAKPNSSWVQFSVRGHVEIRRALKAAAALEGVLMEEKLHSILCKALDREDLMTQAGQ